ncbi:YCF48-related protein [Paraburkholderia sp. GAS32]|uniref:YCF48-related protein n=1 Tax=Paraburkholderia sp. GAS32 TaxID=3035129 RepID=UPI003D244F6B
MRLFHLTTCLIATLGISFNAIATPLNFSDPVERPALLTGSSIRAPVMAIAHAGSTLIAVGQRGHILRAASSDSTWHQVGAPVSTDLVAVSFPSPGRGWAVGHDGVVLRTVDGGATWTRQMDGNEAYKIQLAYYEKLGASGDATAQREASRLKKNASRTPAWPFLDVWFRNDSDGYLVGAFGIVLHTSDAGKNWVPLTDRLDNPQRMHLYAIQGDQDDVYIAGEHGTALRLDPATGRFRSMNPPYTGSFFGVAARDGQIVIYGLNGHAFLSEDRGRTWKALNTGTTQTIVGHTTTPKGDLLFATSGGKIMRLHGTSIDFDEVGVAKAGEIFGITMFNEHTAVVATSVGPKSVQLSNQD